MKTLRLYVFGEMLPRSGDSTHKPFACLYSLASANAGYQETLRKKQQDEIAAGREAYLYDGETAGRDSYPATPDADLSNALRRAGWVRCHAPTEPEKREAEKLGVPVL